MFHPILKRKFEYFTNYFEAALKNDKRAMVQSIILYGQDIAAQYYIAQEIARLLNCKKQGDYNCDCINCNWIRNNQHPAVLTISKNDNKPADDTSKKVISIKQIQSVNNSLISTSEYYRVFIFCDSEVGEINDFRKRRVQEFADLKFSFPQEDWYPCSLNREVLQTESANAMLKSIEEPPERTLFIFLAEDKDDVIETIISRSQCFYIPSFNSEHYDCDFIKSLIPDYPSIKKIDVIDMSTKILLTLDEKGCTFDYFLDALEYYLVQVLKSNITNTMLVQKIKKDILSIQHSKKLLSSYIKPGLILEDLLFGFVK